MSTTQHSERRPVLQPADLKYLVVHLEAEEAALVSVRQMLEQVPGHAGDPAQQRAFRGRVEDALRRHQQISLQRELVLTHLGRVIGCAPADLTLGQVLQHCSPAARIRLQPARQRIARLLRGVQQLSATVGWIVNESRAIHQMLIEVVTGAVTSERYDATGQRAAAGGSVAIRRRL